MTQSAPRVIGRYAVHGELASGGMAAVHFARLIGSDGFARTVALKRPHPHLARDTDFAAMFIDEARLAARIRHPNVVSTLDVIRTPDELVLIMDYVHGEALSKLARAAKKLDEHVPIPIAASIMIDVLHGLHAAHEATDEQGRPLGIVHRDVSPQNVLVGLDGISRIVDFGIAKAAGRSHTTQDGALKGKFSYMAPEQLRGEEVSRLTDVFAASIVMWELITGERLFQGTNDADTMHKALVSRIRPPSMFVPDLPPKFDEILRRGLSRDLGQRFPTAREMALAIEDCVPAIRPSEVSAWVERMAGDVLRARAETIAEMERTPGGDDIEMVPTIAVSSAGRIAGKTPARVSERPPASQSTNASVSWVQMMGSPALTNNGTQIGPELGQNPSDEIPTGISQVSHVADVPVAPEPPPRRSTSRKGAALAALLVLAVLAVSAAAFVSRRAPSLAATPPEPSASIAPPVAAGGDPIAPSVVIAAPSPNASSIPSAAAASGSAGVSAGAGGSAGGSASARDPHGAQAAPAQASPGSHASGGAKSPIPSRPTRVKSECDTPYTIDSVGRRIFKIECM